MAQMDANTLKTICNEKLNNSLGWLGGQLSKDRELAQSYYRGDPFGNEQDGRSKVISRDVAEAIDSVMPGLLKPFVSAETVVRIEPRRPEDEEASAQATDYLNWILQNQPDAFLLIETWQKSGLLNKLGVVKSWWDVKEDIKTEEYEGLTKFQYLSLLTNEDVEPVEVTTKPAPPAQMDPSQVTAQVAAAGETQAAAQQAGQGGQPPAPQPSDAPAQQPDPFDDGLLYDCKIRRVNKTGRILIMAIPPEEFLTDKRTISLSETGFCAHRSRRTVSDLIDMGYDKKVVQDLPGSDDLDFNSETLNRFKDEDGEPVPDAPGLDPSMRKVWYAECYIKVDFDGDGRAEWRKVCLGGSESMEVLSNDETDGHPFSGWCPYPTPHKLFGESMADKTMDIQLIKSTVWRQTLDGMYFNNAPQLTVVEGKVNMEDATTRRPGGIIRQKEAGAVQALISQDVSASGFSMISYLDSVRESRTGVRRFSAGIQADALNPYASTATGAGIVEDSSQDQVMLLCRNFAEQGLISLFGRMLELICKHQNKAQTIRLRGTWVTIDPSAWNTGMDLKVAVGLGTGNRTKTVNDLLTSITQVDGPIIQGQGGMNGPIIFPSNVYKKLTKFNEAMGFKREDGFYTDPTKAPPQAPPQGQQQQPDQAAQVAQAQMQINDRKAQADMARDDRKAANDAQLAQQDMEFKWNLARQKAAHAQALADQKLQHQKEIDMARAQTDQLVAQDKARAQVAGATMSELAKAHVQQATAQPQAAIVVGAPHA